MGGKKKHGKSRQVMTNLRKKRIKMKKGKGTKDGKDKVASSLGNMFKASARKVQEKMKSQTAKIEDKMEKKRIELRQKMKAKGKELRKQMKDKLHEKSEKMKVKIKESTKKMKTKSHDFKAKMREGGEDMMATIKLKHKELKADMKKKARDKKRKMKVLGEKVKHSGEELEKEMAALSGEAATGIRNKLVEWRKPFEEKGWAIGKVQNDWLTLMLLGLNAFTAAMAIPVLSMTIRLVSNFKAECLTFLLTPAVSIGFIFSLSLFIASIVGFAGVWWNRLGIVKIHFILNSLLVLMLLCFTLFGFKVTYQGGGRKLPGISFREYRLTDYSKWLQRKLAENGSVWLDVKSCIAKGSFCHNWNLGSAEEVYSAKLSPIQSGCCAPPYPCGFAYQGNTDWSLPSKPDARPDCSLWDATELCFKCDSCKAGILQNLKSKWYKASMINITVIAALTAILYRTWLVMRMSGRWQSVVQEVKQSVKPTEKKEDKVEPTAIIDIINEGEENNETMEALIDDDEDTVFPQWLKEPSESVRNNLSVTNSENSSSSKSTRGKTTPKEASSARKRKKKNFKQSQETPSEDTKAVDHQLDENDSWASPRQHSDPVIGTFLQGFGTQNPLAAMSPWIQSPQAGYMHDAIFYHGPEYRQTEFYDANYTQFYRSDPYAQLAIQEYQVPQMQLYIQDPQIHHGQDSQMQYMQVQNQMQFQDPLVQDMYIPDHRVQSYEIFQDPYLQDSTQGYQVQAYNINQGYLQDPNQTYQHWQNPSY